MKAEAPKEITTCSPHSIKVGQVVHYMQHLSFMDVNIIELFNASKEGQDKFIKYRFDRAKVGATSSAILRKGKRMLKEMYKCIYVSLLADILASPTQETLLQACERSFATSGNTCKIFEDRTRDYDRIRYFKSNIIRQVIKFFIRALTRLYRRHQQLETVLASV